MALLIAALTATVVLTLLAAGADDAGNDPTTALPQRGPFRGGPLPPELAGSPAPDFRLRDARGGWLSTAHLRGRPYALALLYTNCPDVCPLIGQELRTAEAVQVPDRHPWTAPAALEGLLRRPPAARHRTEPAHRQHLANRRARTLAHQVLRRRPSRTG